MTIIYKQKWCLIFVIKHVSHQKPWSRARFITSMSNDVFLGTQLSVSTYNCFVYRKASEYGSRQIRSYCSNKNAFKCNLDTIWLLYGLSASALNLVTTNSHNRVHTFLQSGCSVRTFAQRWPHRSNMNPPTLHFIGKSEAPDWIVSCSRACEFKSHNNAAVEWLSASARTRVCR